MTMKEFLLFPAKFSFRGVVLICNILLLGSGIAAGTAWEKFFRGENLMGFIGLALLWLVLIWLSVSTAKSSQ